MSRDSVIQMNVRLLGALSDQRRCGQARADIALTPRQSRMLEPSDVSPTVAREDDAMPERRLHREYETTRHDSIVLRALAHRVSGLLVRINELIRVEYRTADLHQCVMIGLGGRER